MPASPDAWQALGILAPVIWLAALGLSSALILILTPVFRNFAVAVPTGRSSHSMPTPQWGGLAISGATLLIVVVAAFAVDGGDAGGGIAYVLAGTLLLVLLGAADDHYELGAGGKLAVQAVAVALMLAALPHDHRALAFLPSWVELALLFGGTLWFVNLVNFMDGIDWMMVAEVVPVTAGIAVIAAFVDLPVEALIVALTLNGAMLGFAPFNRPVAKLFMGDMGSLPIGLLLAWLLLLLAGAGYPIAAILLPLYFLADTGVTLVRRLAAGERLWEAHRTHFYQRARSNGIGNLAVVGRIFAVNVALVLLAVLSVVAVSTLSKLLALFAGVCLVASMMIGFVRGRR